MARTTVELTFPIIEKARGAIFYDTGFVNVSPWYFGFNHIASDVGIGLRLDLPIGPLRIDYGIPHSAGRQQRWREDSTSTSAINFERIT